jgi:hypothetical protein
MVGHNSALCPLSFRCTVLRKERISPSIQLSSYLVELLESSPFVHRQFLDVFFELLTKTGSRGPTLEISLASEFRI